VLKADFVEVATFDTEVAARLAAGCLEEVGIEVVIELEDPAGLFPITGRAAGARLLVSFEDRERAQAFLDLHEQPGSEGRSGSRLDPASVSLDAIRAGLSEIRRRRRWNWFFFLSYLPVGAGAITYVPSAALSVAVFWMLSFAATAVWAGLAVCPRCGERYSRTRYWQNPWTQRCLHCQLSLRTPG
jgi:hypothetical protein